MRLIPYRRELVPFSMMNRLFDGFFDGPARWLPAVDVQETEDDVVVRAEIPGVDPKEVEVSVQAGVLTLRGEKIERKESEGEKGSWHRVERRYGSFERVIPLPAEVDANEAKAEAENGVLTVTLCKRAEDKARKIEVQAGSSR